MRLAHIADTHIGYSAYAKLDSDTGLNQREQDVYSAFDRAIDAIVRARPDAVIHAGDLFDSVRPTNRAISVAMDGLLRLSDAGIPTILISGNHSTPRLRETGSVFRLFEHLSDIQPVYKGGPELVDAGDLAVWAVPHMHADGAMAQAMAAPNFPENARYRVMTAHAGVSGIKEFRTGSFNEQMVPSGCIPRQGVDYVALGHYHMECAIEPRARYAGSLERLSFSEVNHERKGFYIVDLDNPEEPEFVELPTRPMLDLPMVDCAAIPAESVQREIEERIGEVPLDGKMARLLVTNIPRSVHRSLDSAKLRALGESALHFELRFNVMDGQGASGAGPQEFTSLREEFDSFLAKRPVEGVDRDRLMKRAHAYFETDDGGADE